MSDKKHIDFDLDFLNRHEKGKCKVKRSRQSEGHDASRSGGVKEDRPSSQKKRIDYEVSGAKSVLAIVVVVALIVVFVISTHSKSDVKSSNTQSKPAYSIMDDDTNYLCSSYHMKKLNKMNVSRKEQANLDKEYGLLEKDMRSLKALETKLSNTENRSVWQLLAYPQVSMCTHTTLRVREAEETDVPRGLGLPFSQ